MPPRTPVEEATVLLPNVFPHYPPVVYKADETLDPEGRPFDGERGHLAHANSTQARANAFPQKIFNYSDLCEEERYRRHTDSKLKVQKNTVKDNLLLNQDFPGTERLDFLYRCTFRFAKQCRKPVFWE